MACYSDNRESYLLQTVPTDEESYIKILNLLKCSLLTEQSDDCTGNNLSAESFNEHISTTEINILQAISIFTSMNIATSIPKDVVLFAVLLNGEHSGNENWTCPQIQSSMEKLQKIILEQCGCNDIRELLLLYKIPFFLSELKPKLTLSTWKKYPAAVICFIWILQHIKFPHLADNINIILPTCLLLVDDNENSNKVKGLKCLHYLTKNVSRTDLIQYGRGDVIYSAVEHMIYLRDPEIIPELGTFLAEFLSKTEHSFTSNSLSWSHFDDVLNIWLPSMEMEQNVVMREAYIDSLKGLLQSMGIASIRWSDKLLRVLSEYTEQEHTLDKALLCLLTFINTTWLKISSNAHCICLILMKILIRIYNKGSGTKPSERTEKVLKECFYSLKTISDKEYNRLMCELKGNDEMYQLYTCIFEE